jgi:diphosphomevalonate decarboxylase
VHALNKKETVQALIGTKNYEPKNSASSFAPVNIALVKYWGKRNSELNLPVTSSLSLSLPLGTHTSLKAHSKDLLFLNGKQVDLQTSFAKKLFDFVDLFRDKKTTLFIETKNDIPTGAGLASSASGFAALTLALNDFFSLQLSPKELSILARLGSGSASRSLFSGFVQWHKGVRDDGLDSYAEPLDARWDDLSIGLWIISDKTKPIDSRQAMQNTVESSPLYKAWPDTVSHDLSVMKEAIKTHNFSLLGRTAEQNALTMHATMLAAYPSIVYFLPESIEAMQKIWQLRKDGLEVYFTMDAGPNIKLLFLEKDRKTLESQLPNLHTHSNSIP